MRVRMSFCAALAVLFVATAAAAAEIKVVSVGALQTALRDIAADYTRETGDTVTFTFTNPTNLKQVLAGGTFDVVIVAASTVDELRNTGGLAPGAPIHLARTGIGVAVREGAPKPDLSTPEAFKKAVLAARNVLYTDPTTANGSGALTLRILTAAGLADAVKAKGMQSNLAGGKELIAKGEYEMGFFNVSETPGPGVVLAGPVPAPLQLYTNYDAALLKETPVADRAGAFLRYIASPARGPQWTAAGMELMTGR